MPVTEAGSAGERGNGGIRDAASVAHGTQDALPGDAGKEEVSAAAGSVDPSSDAGPSGGTGEAVAPCSSVPGGAEGAEEAGSPKGGPTIPAITNLKKKRKVALFMAYVGHGYNGMQRNPGVPTIEEDLFKAIANAGGISDANNDDAGYAKVRDALGCAPASDGNLERWRPGPNVSWMHRK